MSQTLEQIRQYWNSRAEGYTLSNREELEDEHRIFLWEQQIRRALNGRICRHVLDVGCGPGFFSVLLARLGYEVTAVDYTENMLAEARKNAVHYGVDIDFRRMDAQKLDFEDGIFDLVISRNVLWNLEQPEQAYREWLRVLKPNGTVMNFDGNFYYYVTDAEYGDRTRWEHKHMQGINANSIDRIGEHLPMARRLRPEWDVQELQKLGAKEVCSNVTNEKILEDGHHLILNFQVSAVKAQV
ncbi:class I SAM-dependent methyltransferase [Hominiventricola filiformis]|uniref:Class I SAM-dependent methyltransferase n=1 Tax=Hominiventricola filiformis TaxID=2885352 RepID=A0AAE3A371_9FIRM|nr:class I SAM-dependent methyltransferase [Hominiventricola filiformis]MCC2125222.1 class I SAM-dependent methyltransferase [Hominiventricola filiformis]QUO20887.1 class I SAM-dependent methyltransferase [Clostridiaceae bacterium Marseille-Q4143]